jgi:hypothetical protein
MENENYSQLQNASPQPVDEINDDVENDPPVSLYALHGTKLMMIAQKGKKKAKK